jgi:diguanylate cyclase (GGDEF)-like protein
MNIDELTELPGRRPFRHHLRCLGGEYTMAVVDIDHFKAINDTYGHAVGDQVLKFLAAELSRQAAGRVYRYGGEEFAVIYESGAYEQVLDNLDDLRDAVSHKTFYLRGPDRTDQKPRRRQASAGTPSRQITLTISIGAARAGARYATPQATFEAADQALYRAKEQGRNRVCYVK